MSTNYRDIEGFPGYRVGDDGTVWSARLKGRSGAIGDVWKQIASTLDGKGNLHLGLRRGKNGYCRNVAVLVLEAFVCKRPQGARCEYLDGDKTNCRIDNLRWMPQGEYCAKMRMASARFTRPRAEEAELIARAGKLKEEIEALNLKIKETPIEYRPAPGFPGYMVGNDGSIWSKRRPVIDENGEAHWRKIKLSGAKKTGHMSFSKGRVTIGVQRLVLMAFVGPPPAEGMLACHYPDPNPRNNHIANLRWDTPKANTQDAIVHGSWARGSNHPACKIHDADIPKIRELAKTHSGKELCDMFDVKCISTIKRVLNGRRKAAFNRHNM